MDIEEIRDLDGRAVCKAIGVVYKGSCGHCNIGFSLNDMVYCLGKPYHCIVHRQCAVYFNFNQGYPHSAPYQFYIKK